MRDGLEHVTGFNCAANSTERARSSRAGSRMAGALSLHASAHSAWPRARWEKRFRALRRVVVWDFASRSVAKILCSRECEAGQRPLGVLSVSWSRNGRQIAAAAACPAKRSRYRVLLEYP